MTLPLTLVLTLVLVVASYLKLTLQLGSHKLHMCDQLDFLCPRLEHRIPISTELELVSQPDQHGSANRELRAGVLSRGLSISRQSVHQ